ncbi:DUF418 domain-containing protein [Streptomyces sp. NPDC059378]|uniref:DUF418 domain-containing protein n=1 Tax=Streptomyces sp. NPDC059378 TaxID=3346815 RepID=UPI0036944E40
MTHDAPSAVALAAPPADAGSAVPPSTGRLIGIDLARGLAIVGMFAVHLGPDPSVGGVAGWLLEVAGGRSSTLFAVLAGFTLVLLTGRPQSRTGRAGRQAMGRVLIRAAVLMALGYVLTALDTPVDVILSYYGLLFVLALPFHRLRARTLAAVAAAGAVVLPLALYLLRAAAGRGDWSETVAAHDPLARVTGTDGFVGLFVTGDYPVLTWFPFIVAGMALAKTDLTRPRALARTAACGVALAVAGYGGSWLALHLVPGARAAVSAAVGGGPAGSAWWSDAVGGPPLPGRPAWLLVASPHSETTGSIVGNTGVALVVVAASLLATARFARVRRLGAPVIALGSVSLSAYVGHIVAIKAFGIGDDMSDAESAAVLVAFVTVAMLLALAWTRRFRRGPLEYAMHTATTPAQLIQ